MFLKHLPVFTKGAKTSLVQPWQYFLFLIRRTALSYKKVWQPANGLAPELRPPKALHLR